MGEIESAPGAIVVGVTGGGRETAALRFAAECARRDGADVVIAHAFGTTVPPTMPGVLLTCAEAAAVARTVVGDVEQELATLYGDSVRHRVVTAPVTPSHLLVDLGREARLVVVQHRDATWLGRLFVGSTVSSTATHCDCPVVSVPLDWAPRASSGEVVVGVHECGAPLPAVAAGFAWAAATGATLRVVHAWRLDGAYDDIISARVAEEWHAEQLQALESAVLDLRRQDPSVPVELEVRHAWPAQALVDDSRSASLVVVGRHARNGQPTGHLGSVARSVLREAHSPVMVVPLV
jgi:nucleotide-binding universal stress UspA family protein